MENIYNDLKESDDDIEFLYKKMFMIQYKNIFIPELSSAIRDGMLLSKPSQQYINTLNRSLFDHCICLLRSQYIDKDIVDSIRDLYLQFKIYSFDANTLVNSKIQTIGKHNIDYSIIILNNFKTLKDENVFLSVLPLFNIENKNFMMDEIKNNYSK